MTNEFMEKMLKANKRNLIREVNFTYDDIVAMSNENIEKNAKEISGEALWVDNKAKLLFEIKVADIQAPNIIQKARRRQKY